MSDAPLAPSIEALLRDNRFAAVTSAGFALQDVNLRRLKGSERLGEPFRYTATLASRDPIRNFGRLPGQRITVGMKLKDAGVRYFNGFVTEFSYLGLDDTRRPHYAAEIRPWLSLLGLRRNSRIFQNRTSLDIVTTLFTEHGGTFRNLVSGWLPTRPYCVQYDETDLDFVSRLMEEDGLYYYFEHDEQRHDLVLLNEAARHPGCSPREIETHLNLRRFRQREDIFWAWRETATLVGAAVALDSYDPEKPAANLSALADVMSVNAGEVPVLNSTQASGSMRGGDRIPTVAGRTVPGGGAGLSETFLYPGRYLERRAADFHARLHAEVAACQSYRVHVEGSARQVTTGCVFRAANPFDIADKAMAPPPDQRFVALGLDFEVMGDVGAAADAGNEPPQFYSAVVEAMPADTQFRPPRRTARPRIGAQTAVVCGRPGETITTDHLGRIKLHFFWDRLGRRDESSSCWVRVAQNWAGKGHGGLVIPRVGQEVLVEFLHDDPDQPIVVGCVYNGANLPPEELPERATRSTFRTRTEGATGQSYNELRFEDRAGGEGVHLRAQRHHTADVQQHYVLSAGDGAAISTRGAAVLESGMTVASPIGSRIEVTPDGITLRVVAMGLEQSILIGADGITINGKDIQLLAAGKIETSVPALPANPRKTVAAMVQLKQDALRDQMRRTQDALAAPFED